MLMQGMLPVLRCVFQLLAIGGSVRQNGAVRGQATQRFRDVSVDTDLTIS